MKRYVLDASALLRFIEDGPGGDLVEELINQAEAGRIRIVLSAVNWGEVYYVMRRVKGVEQADSYSTKLRELSIEIVEADQMRAERAAIYHLRIPYADSFAAALAAEETATLVTGDYDFKNVEEVIAVEFLPAKRKRPAH